MRFTAAVEVVAADGAEGDEWEWGEAVGGRGRGGGCAVCGDATTERCSGECEAAVVVAVGGSSTG